MSTKKAFCGCVHSCWKRYPRACRCKPAVCRSKYGGPCGCIQPGSSMELNKNENGHWIWTVERVSFDPDEMEPPREVSVPPARFYDRGNYAIFVDQKEGECYTAEVRKVDDGQAIAWVFGIDEDELLWYASWRVYQYERATHKSFERQLAGASS